MCVPFITKLKSLVRVNNYDYPRLAKIDQRFDVYESTDAAARFLKDLKKRFGTWDRALSAYNRGTPARNPKATQHVKMTRLYQRYYLKHKENLGMPINTENLAQLEDRNGFDFRYEGKNSQGIPIYSYHVQAGDNATIIADNFNRWDKKHQKDKHGEVGYQNIVRRDGSFVGNRLKPEDKIFVKARSKI